LDWKRCFRPRARAQLTPELRARIQSSFDRAAGDEEHFPVHHRPAHLPRQADSRSTWARWPASACSTWAAARAASPASSTEQEPQAELWGLDISEAMLRFVPEGIHTRAGSMTELPFADDFFDGAYATESLEHAVEIEKAVSEICRVVKAGRPHRHHRQERRAVGQAGDAGVGKWFTRRELERLLRRHCREVSSRPISYWEDVKPDGLFLAWLAVK
jgi:SAM-dependent methyltransferase